MRARFPKDGLLGLFAGADWVALWRLFVFVALLFFIFATVNVYLGYLRPLALNAKLEDIEARLTKRVSALADEMKAAEARTTSAVAAATAAEQRRAALEAEVIALEQRRGAAKSGRAAPSASAAGAPVSGGEASGGGDKVRELQRELAKRDTEIDVLKRGIAELRSDPRRSAGGGGPLAMSLQERKRFVVQEFVAKVAILANRNRVQLEFAKAMVAAVQLYEQAGSPFPDGVVAELFLRNYPRLRGIDLFTTGSAIIDRQMDSVEFMLLEETDRKALQGQIRRFTGNTASFAQPLVLQLDGGATPEQFTAELGRVESAFSALFGDLERLQTELLAGG